MLSGEKEGLGKVVDLFFPLLFFSFRLKLFEGTKHFWMSSHLSLCLQRRGSGRLFRTLQQLNGSCKDYEAKLAQDIGKVSGIGCSQLDKSDAFRALTDLAESKKSQTDGDDTLSSSVQQLGGHPDRKETVDKNTSVLTHPHESECSERVKARALICTVLLAEKETDKNPQPLVSLDKMKNSPIPDSETKTGIQFNERMRVELAQRAADMGDTFAMTYCGKCLITGGKAPQDKDKGVKLLHQAADTNNVDAMVLLGNCYEKGDEVQRDTVKAFEFFKRAANNGNAEAMIKCGDYLLNEKGIPPKQMEALEWYRRAADLGCTDAKTKLFSSSFKGNQMIQDEKKGIEWYQQAADLGNTSGTDKLSLSVLYVTSTQDDSTSQMNAQNTSQEKTSEAVETTSCEVHENDKKTPTSKHR